MAFQSQGPLFAWSNGRETTLVDRETGSEVRRLPSGGRLINFSPSGRLLAIDNGPVVTIWDSATRENLQTIKPHMMRRSSLAFDFAESQLLMAGTSIELRDVATGEAIPAAFGDEIGEDAAFSRDGRRLYVTARDGRMVNVYCALSGHRTLHLPCDQPIADAESLDPLLEKLIQQWEATE